MSDETLERFIRQHIAAQVATALTFARQGRRTDHDGATVFRRVVALCEKYGDGRHHSCVADERHLVNDEWARFFRWLATL